MSTYQLKKHYFSENFKCPDNFFKCDDGHCLSPSLVCDGIRHCLRGEDELFCSK